MDNTVLSGLFRSFTGTMPEKVTMLPLSGGHRKYFRLSGNGFSAIGVSGTDLQENNAFCTMARHFRDKGINVPEIYAVSEDGMSYLQEDLGSVSLFDYVAEGRRKGVYEGDEKDMLLKAVAGLPALQYGETDLPEACCRPGRFDGRMVMFDLNYFKYCFLKPVGTVFDEYRLQSDFESLCEDISSVPACTFMYRDFQSRNVMVKDGLPYYIDFQGGMTGPAHYDVASFVWQARAGYPAPLKMELINAYLEAVPGHLRPDPVDFHEKLRLFVLLRTLQVLGAYGFRGYYEGKEHFLKSIPAAFRNLDELLSAPFEAYPYLDKVLRLLSGAFARGEIRYMAEDGGTAVPESTQKAVCTPVPSTGKPVLTVSVYSFSYRKGIPEDRSGNGGGYVFDCRSIHNPGKYDRYKTLTGMDAPVVKFLEDDGEVSVFMDSVYRLVDAHVKRFLERGFTSLTVCFGCTGGQHRSVYCAESLARHLAGTPGVSVELVHRERGIVRTYPCI